MPIIKYREATEPCSMHIPATLKNRAKDRARELGYNSLTHYVVALLEWELEAKAIKPYARLESKRKEQDKTPESEAIRLFNENRTYLMERGEAGIYEVLERHESTDGKAVLIKLREILQKEQAKTMEEIRERARQKEEEIKKRMDAHMRG